MAYLIDTNICIHARDGTDAVLDKLAQHDGQVLLSALSLALVFFGAGPIALDAILGRGRGGSRRAASTG